MKYCIPLLLLSLCPMVNADNMAQDQGFYVGGVLGVTEYDNDDFFNDSVVTGGDFDDFAAGLGAIGGYNLNRWLSFETGLTILGNYYEEGDGANDDDFIDTNISALTVSTLGQIPMGNIVRLYVQAGFGLAFVAQEIDYDDTGINIEEDESDTSTMIQLGVGIKINLPPRTHTQLRFGYQRYMFEAELSKVNSSDMLAKDNIDQTIDFFFLGANYVF